ncbi:hypothetical protein O6P43_020216 [Quillaja saponaria]|uniref:Uncharacterized protein n=1 Tax=Quillaja saponaria TaxID=32244 RepID=A0AAD7LKQ0_QUISA|nr:hypothetical protein O6P43_020216 [Quillaja saponaria]
MKGNMEKGNDNVKRVWNGRSGLNKGRCLYLQDTLIGNIHWKETDRRYVQRWYDLHKYAMLALPENLPQILDPTLLQPEAREFRAKFIMVRQK